MSGPTTHLEATGVVVGGELTGTARLAYGHPGAAFRLSLHSGDDVLNTTLRAVNDRLVDSNTDCHAYADFLAAHEGAEVHFIIDRQ